MITLVSDFDRPEPLDILIADDEPVALETLRRMTEEDPRLRLVGEATNGLEVVDLVEETRPDVAFLDIEMPGLSGVDALHALSRASVQMPMVVFTTAYEEYAVRAFELRVVDYLLKPFDRDRFRESVRRTCCFATLTESVQRLGPSVYSNEEMDRFFLRDHGRLVPVSPRDILYFQASGDAVTATTEGRTLLVDLSLKELDEQLGDRFVRANRSSLVNRKGIRSIERHDARRLALVMEDGERIVASKRRSRSIRRQMLKGSPGPISG